MVSFPKRRKFQAKTKKRRFTRRRTRFLSRRRYGARRSFRRFRRRVSRIVRSLSEVKWTYIDGSRDFTVGTDYFALLLAPSFTSGGSWSNIISQGTGKNDRIGQLVRTRRISLQCVIGYTGTETVPTNTFWKVAIVSFRGGEYSLVSLPPASVVWEAVGLPVSPYLSMYHSETIKVHKQWKFITVNSESNFPTRSRFFTWEFSFPYRANWRWTDAAAFSGDDTLLWLVMHRWDDQVSLVNNYRFRARGRISYIDI